MTILNNSLEYINPKKHNAMLRIYVTLGQYSSSKPPEGYVLGNTIQFCRNAFEVADFMRNHPCRLYYATEWCWVKPIQCNSEIDDWNWQTAKQSGLSLGYQYIRINYDLVHFNVMKGDDCPLYTKFDWVQNSSDPSNTITSDSVPQLFESHFVFKEDPIYKVFPVKCHKYTNDYYITYQFLGTHEPHRKQIQVMEPHEMYEYGNEAYIPCTNIGKAFNTVVHHYVKEHLPKQAHKIDGSLKT